MPKSKLKEPIFVYPLKKLSSYELPVEIAEFFKNSSYIAMEITVSESSFSRMQSFLKKVEQGSNGKSIYYRFHTMVCPEYDPFDTNQYESHKNIEYLSALIQKNFGGGYLILHSNKTPSKAALQRASVLVRNCRKKGVILALENLTQGWSSNIDLFTRVLKETGFKAVLDIGHLNSSDGIRSGKLSKLKAAESLLPYLIGAHIYEHEYAGHYPPQDLLSIGDLLHLLIENEVYWWVIEIENPDAFLSTFKLLSGLLKS